MADYMDVGDADFQSEVLESKVPVLVDFWAPWCAPCRALSPHVEALATEYKGRAKVVKVNTQEHQKIASQLGIRGIPAIFMFDKGEVVGQLNGLPRDPKARLKSLIDGAIA